MDVEVFRVTEQQRVAETVSGRGIFCIQYTPFGSGVTLAADVGCETVQGGLRSCSSVAHWLTTSSGNAQTML